jgi:hypothetical protein
MCNLYLLANEHLDQEQPMALTESTNRYFEALAEAQNAMFDAARSAGANQLSLQQRLVEEFQTAQQRSFDLSRRVVEQAADVPGNVAAFVEAMGDAQSQALGVARLLVEGTPEAQSEARSQFERISKANRELFEAAFAAGREYFAASPWFQAFRPAAEAAAAG